MPVLNTFRCQACTNEIESTNLFWLRHEAEIQGWLVTGDVESLVTLCPEHYDRDEWAGDAPKLPAKVLAWTAGCHNCDWEEDFLDEEEARYAKRSHSCSDYRDDWEDTYLLTPEERLQRHQEDQKRQVEFDARREARVKAEQLAKQKEDADRAVLEAEAALGRKYAAILLRRQQRIERAQRAVRIATNFINQKVRTRW